MTPAPAEVPAWEGQFVVSRAEGMTLYGRIVGQEPSGLLNITRFWRTARDSSRTRPYDWEPYDREAEAADWFRRPGECELYDFAKPLYDCYGNKYTSTLQEQQP